MSLATMFDQIIAIDECVLCFDKSLVEQLPQIMAERCRIRSRQDASKNKDLPSLLSYFDSRLGRTVEIAELPSLLIEGGIDPAAYPPHLPSEVPKADFDKWTTVQASNSRHDVIALQKDLGMGAHNPSKKRYDAAHPVGRDLALYLRSVTTPKPSLLGRLTRLSFWEMKLKLWRLLGQVSFEAP